ncbi:MAG: ComF family protein [Candidatus Dormibacteria bacterium]
MYSPGSLASVLLDAVAPPRCAACGVFARAICPGCVRALELLPEPPVVTVGAVDLHAAFLYSSPLRELLHVGKYRDGRSALRVAALLAAERCTALPAPAILVPVPLGPARLRARGYNQAETVAGVVAGVVGAVLRPWLRRIRETGSQVGRSPADRASNLAGAFGWVGPRDVAGRIWVVDDVITTGATMLAAIRAVPSGSRGGLRGVALARAGAHLRPDFEAPARRRRGIMEI